MRNPGASNAAGPGRPPGDAAATAERNVQIRTAADLDGAENGTDDTWRDIRHELDRMHLVTLATADGQVAQRSVLTAGQKAILSAIKLGEPPRFFDFTVPSD